MTPEEVRALSDFALSKIIAEQIMGHRWCSVAPCVNGEMTWWASHWHLSDGSTALDVSFVSDWNTMGALIEWMRDGGYEVMLLMNRDGHGCLFTGPTTACQYADTLPRAVAEAAVLARAAQYQEEMNDAE